MLGVVKEGYPIDVNENTLIFMHYIKIGKSEYRPLHVVCNIDYVRGELTVITIYDPRSQAWKWDNTFEKRVCFCKK